MSRTALPKGFFSSGINCGVRKYRPDLGLILSDRDATAVAVYTRNECKAAPVLYSRALTPSARVRAIVTNSGQANAATGPEGERNNLRMAEAVAQALGCGADQVLTASTGVIGVPLDIEKITRHIPQLVARATDAAEPLALAILTTDLIPKTVTTTVALSAGTVRISGISKGSGMIHPNMATMLGYLLTDARLDPGPAQECLREVTDVSFNMISVDGDMSTNDTVFLMANGASGCALTTSEDCMAFRHALIEVAQALARAIARDGEGSTKLIEVQLQGGPSAELARVAARGVTMSPLVKAAMHGEDPNWGRILARLGADGVPPECLAKLSLSIQGMPIMGAGLPLPFDRDAVRTELKRETVRILINLDSGNCSATAWGCDLSAQYVAINSEYPT
jgi:glutamate N-acetyltransferase/amino-acid N-acetyltransferase